MYLAGEQRRLAAGRKIVCEGRDQGTFVFPHAECKFFLEARAEVRANRRWKEMLHTHPEITLEEVLTQQRERDTRDGSRAMAPMKPAADAVRIDTSEMTLEEVIDRMEMIVRQKMPR